MAIEAVGRRTPVQAATDVFALSDKDGASISKAKQAAAKSSLRITYGEKNHAAGVFAKTTETAQNLDDRLLHKDSDLVTGAELRDQHGVPELN